MKKKPREPCNCKNALASVIKVAWSAAVLQVTEAREATYHPPSSNEYLHCERNGRAMFGGNSDSLHGDGRHKTTSMLA